MSASLSQAQDEQELDEKSQAFLDELKKIAEGEGSDEVYAKLVKMSDELIANAKPFGINEYRVVNTAGGFLLSRQEFDHATHIYKALKKASASVEGELGLQMVQVAEYSLENVKTAVAKLEMIGKPMEIAGTTVAGEEFSMEQYKGKIVLVDFWATWCGPCIAELPNVKANYEKYHEKGLEIVGISLDEAKKQAAVAKFIEERGINWVNLFSSDPEATGWTHPLATKYGVNAIPATFLIDREGNIMAMDVRGEQLGAKLEEVFADGK
ncbi:MAG: TlpA family protein disulfide reductase [Pirellulales bacterium]|nr:TlpA family protein disulfide reductase [Pirellulales bacterium]